MVGSRQNIREEWSRANSEGRVAAHVNDGWMERGCASVGILSRSDD